MDDFQANQELTVSVRLEKSQSSARKVGMEVGTIRPPQCTICRMKIDIATKPGLSNSQLELLGAWRDEMQEVKQGKRPANGSLHLHSFEELDCLRKVSERVHAIYIDETFVGGLTTEPADSHNLNLLWRHWNYPNTGRDIALQAKRLLGIRTCTRCNPHSARALNDAGIPCKEISSARTQRV